MKNQTINIRFGILTLMVLLAALSRLLPHPPNVAPIGAMALFGAAYFTPKRFALIIPLLAMWISDLILNNAIYSQYYEGFTLFASGSLWVFGAFILIGLAGFILLKVVRVGNLLLASLTASFIFFLVSNFGVWTSGTLYPKTMEGLWACYLAALPFLRNTLLGDLFFTGVLFGTFELIQYRFPSLRTHPA